MIGIGSTSIDAVNVRFGELKIDVGFSGILTSIDNNFYLSLKGF